MPALKSPAATADGLDPASAFGKYLSFAFAVQEEAKRLGFEIGVLSGDMADIFRESLGDVFGGFDLLWTGLAVVSAWRLLRPDAPEPAPAAEPPTA